MAAAAPQAATVAGDVIHPCETTRERERGKEKTHVSDRGKNRGGRDRHAKALFVQLRYCMHTICINHDGRGVKAKGRHTVIRGGALEW